MKQSTEYYGSLRQEWRLAGRCIDCGDVVATSADGAPLKKCAKHSTNDREKKSNQKNRRAALCQCVQCGTKLPLAVIFVAETCPECKKINCERVKSSNSKRAETNI
jgi:hypothetical protein